MYKLLMFGVDPSAHLQAQAKYESELKIIYTNNYKAKHSNETYPIIKID